MIVYLPIQMTPHEKGKFDTLKKMKIKPGLLNFLRVLTLVFLTLSAFGQAGGPPDPGPPENPPVPDDQPVPITGIEYLLISGGILGGYKLFKNRKEEKNQ